MKQREELITLGLEGFKADEVMLLEQKMMEGAMTFQYRKKDGTIRNAVGTLSRRLMKQEDGTLWEPKGETKPDVPQWFKYFDLDAKSWRQFDVTQLIAVGR